MQLIYQASAEEWRYIGCAWCHTQPIIIILVHVIWHFTLNHYYLAQIDFTQDIVEILHTAAGTDKHEVSVYPNLVCTCYDTDFHVYTNHSVQEAIEELKNVLMWWTKSDEIKVSFYGYTGEFRV